MRILASGEIVIGLLKCENRFGQIIQAQAVCALPLAALVFVAHFKNDFGQRHFPPVVYNDVLKHRSPDRTDLERDFWFSWHIPLIPPIDRIYRSVTIDKEVAGL